MQRVIEFNEDDIIKSISIKRPTSGLQSSTTRETNYHIAAMQIGVDTAQTLIGFSYLAALEKLNEHSCNLVTFPGFLCLASDRRQAILGLLDELQISIEEARASRPTNYAANIERLLEKYIQVLDQLDFTYHESGNGAVGGDGEGPAAESFRNASASGHIDERLLIEKSLKLIDLRGWSPTVSEAAEPIGQAILKMMASYEFLTDEPYLVTAIIGRFATELGLDSADLYRAVTEYVPIRF